MSTRDQDDTGNVIADSSTTKFLREQNALYLDLLDDCWSQWCYRGIRNGQPVWTDGGLSTLEELRAALVEAGRIDAETGMPKEKNK